jgi:hypothetical protein
MQDSKSHEDDQQLQLSMWFATKINQAVDIETVMGISIGHLRMKLIIEQ